MRAVVQRVSRAEVRVAGEVVGRIGAGLAVLLGAGKGDGGGDVELIADKILNLRIFEDEAGKMNRSLLDTRGGLLCVSQFTLYGDVRKGRRPSFVDALEPGAAETLYEDFVARVRAAGVTPVATGRFGAMMEVDLVNHGPVTILLDSHRSF
jgi:D-tyrosyl-tRNA(Tyr) deacylase